MRRCPLLNETWRESCSKVAHFSRFPNFSRLLGANLCWRKFLVGSRGYLSPPHVLKPWAEVHISSLASWSYETPDDSLSSIHMRTAFTIGWKRRVGREGWMDGEKRTKLEPISEIEFTRKFHSLYKGIWVGNFESDGIDLRCKLKDIVLWCFEN